VRGANFDIPTAPKMTRYAKGSGSFLILRIPLEEAALIGTSRSLRGLLTLGIAASGLVSVVPAAAHTRAPSAAHAHVVLAVIEDAVNVYHRDFAAAGRTRSPSTWIPGYPRSAQPLHLHLNATSFASARQADDAVWAKLRPSQLYYIPGTKFAGLIWMPSPLDRQTSEVTVSYPPPSEPTRPVIDGYTYHGTGVASVAAGKAYGTCPDCDLVVVAAENFEQGLEWAARQPWIDIISNSWGGPLGAPAQVFASDPTLATSTGPSAGSLAAARAGKIVVFGSGNGVTDLGPTTHGTQHSLTWDSPYAGPPWVLAVGAAKAGSGQPTDWHNIPVDVIAQGEDRLAADSASLTGTEIFIGTSCSAPIAAGVIGEALYRARAALADSQVGPRNGSLLSGRVAHGPDADGRLTVSELLNAARAVATWHAFDPSTVSADPTQAFATPTTPAAFAYEGFGLLDRNSVSPLTKVLLGQMPQPARPEMQQWSALAEQVRSGRWGTA
jgi:hypothetical protein